MYRKADFTARYQRAFDAEWSMQRFVESLGMSRQGAQNRINKLELRKTIGKLPKEPKAKKQRENQQARMRKIIQKLVAK
jgi:hypothetical protein